MNAGDVIRWFLHFICWMSAIFLRWSTDLESIPHASTPTTIIRTKFEVDVTIHCRLIAILSLDTSRDLVTLTFWPWTVVIHGGSRDHLCHQVWRPYAYPILSYELQRFRWLPLRMRTRPLCMRRITWPVSRGSKKLHFWNLRPRFSYSLCNFCGSTMNVIKVICEKNARPFVNTRMSFCACAKSGDLLKVP